MLWQPEGIGEDPLGLPNNLFPFITQIAAGQLEKLRVFGDNYLSHNGPGIRDYLRALDLTEAQKAAVEHLLQQMARLPESSTSVMARG